MYMHPRPNANGVSPHLYHNKTVEVLSPDQIPLPDFYAKAFKKHPSITQPIKSKTPSKVEPPKILKSLPPQPQQRPQPPTQQQINSNSLPNVGLDAQDQVDLDALFSSLPISPPVVSVRAQVEPAVTTPLGGDLEYDGPSIGNFDAELDALLDGFF